MKEASLKMLHTVMPPYTVIWKRQNNSSSRGEEQDRRRSRAQRILTGVIIHCIMMDIYVNTHLSKPINCITSRVNPEVNYELWVIMMSQCMLIFG